jgi:DNA-binding LytR/AlgR family response regulator
VKPFVVFTTAYSHHAVQAFKENAVDYLLKPIQLNELINAIEKVKQQKQNKLLQYQLIEKLADAGASKKYRAKFLFEKGSKFFPVKTEEIAFFYSRDKIVTAYLFNGQKFICDESLDKLEEQCDPSLYFRGNRQIILGHKSIREIHNWYKGRLKITLTIPFEEDVFISAEKSSSFKCWLRE